MNGVKLVPLTGINLDLANQYMPPNKARYVKNLYYTIQDAGSAGDVQGAQTGVMKPLPSFEQYVVVALPEGENIPISANTFKETNDLYVWVWNSLKNHCIYRILGSNKTAEIIKIDPLFNFQLQPEYSIGEFQCWLEILHIVDPNTGTELIKQDLYWTDAFNPQGYLRTEDCIASNGFNETIYPYFAGDYNKSILLRVGIPTPKNCIAITDVPITDEERGKVNTLLYKAVQLRLSITDVYGRPSEHSIISDVYIPGINDCISSSSSLPRCIDATFDIDNPLWDTVQVEYSINNSPQWYVSDTLFLYEGSAIGDWWLRKRNPELNYNGNSLTYRFCLDSERIAIDPAETGRLYNPLAKSSQSITKLGTRIGFSNNRDGFIPVALSEKQKIQVTVEPPQAGGIDLRTITIYIPIYNAVLSQYTPVRKDGTAGYIWGDNDSQHGGARRYNQFFTNPNQSGFLGYLIGGNSSISTQVYLDANGVLVDDPEHIGADASPSHFTMQKFVFTNIPKGNYIFRLAASTFDTTTGGAFENTSTTIWGVCPFSRNINGSFVIGTGQRENVQELLINVCDGNYDTLTSGDMLVIADLASHVGGLGQNNSKVTVGYIYSTRKNGFNQNPVELMQINPEHRSNFTSLSTDYNGFYWLESREAGRTFNIYFNNKCSKSLINVALPSGDQTGIFVTNIYIDEYNNEQYADYPDTACNEILVKGTIKLGDIGVPNVPVTLTRGGTSTTDDNGNFVIVAHDDIIAGTRHDNVVVENGICYYTNTEGECIPVSPVTINPCSTCVERVVTVNTILVAYLSQRGLLSGGRYGIGFNRWDWLGRTGALQDATIITIPTINQSKTIAPSKVRVIFPSNFTLPLDTEYITIALTKELSIETYISWIVDSAVFIDNTGNENLTSPTQIKIYYQSLNEYNKQNNFNTTTNWQFLESIPNSTSTPFTSDVVRFYINGDGTFYDKAVTALVKYDQIGQYFLIDYTSDLATLTKNALIRLERPKTQTSDTEPYYEVCKVIPVVNGQPTIKDFYINAFDTYYLNRLIPVPTNADPAGTTTQTQNVLNTTNPDSSVTTRTITTDNTINPVTELRLFGFPFEHDSPSNFWGKGVENIGRANVKNPYENEIIHLYQTELSGVLSANSQLSYLQYFQESLKHNYDIPNSGGITALGYQQGFVFGICKNGNFVVGYNDNLMRTNADGTVSTPSAANGFGQPERRIGSKYGCYPEEKLTIKAAEDETILAYFLDTQNGGLVESNLQSAILVSELNDSYAKLNSTVRSWILPKIKSVEEWNNNNPNNKRYFHGVINPANGEYLLSDFQYHNTTYINNEREPNVFVPETMAWDTNSKVWKGAYSFTPQLFGYANGEILGQNQLFAVKDGQPYNLYDVGNFTRKFNTFFGVKCGRVYKYVLCVDGSMKQFFNYHEIYCRESCYFADIIRTEAKQLSYLMLSQYRKANFFWQATFMCDTNTPNTKNPAFEGNRLYGTWIEVRLIGDPSKDDIYSEFYGVNCFTTPLMKSGAIKT